MSASGIAMLLALALEARVMVNQHASLQAIADETALSLATEQDVAAQSRAQLRSVAQARVAAQLTGKSQFADQNPTIEAFVLPKLRRRGNNVDEEPDIIQVDITSEYARTGLARFLVPEIREISVTARAVRLGAPNLCVIALHPLNAATLGVSNSARLTAPNCDIISNSTDPAGLASIQSATLEAKTIHSAGGFGGTLANYTPAPTTDSVSVPDPLKAIPDITPGPCDVTSSQPVPGRRGTLSPGVYCNGLRLDGSRIVTFEPGIYTFLDDVEFVSGTEITGNNVTFHFVESGFTVNPNVDLSMTAPTTGPTAGLLIYADRNNTGAHTYNIYSANARYLVGTVYIPKGVFRVQTDAPVSDLSEYTAIVADRIEIKGSSNLYLNTDYEATDVPVPDGIGPGDEEGVMLVR